MMEEKKKALAVVAGPYRFCQILWLYALHPEYRWSILLLPYGKGNDAAQKLEAACRKLGIFEHIFRPQVVGEHSPFGQKLALAAKMCLFYVTGRKKVFMRRMLEKMTDGEKFSAAFVGCEYSILEGAIIGLADEMEVSIFEEGLGDYCERRGWSGFNMETLTGFLFSRMGYFNPGYCFELRNTRLCVKYSSRPDMLKYRKYRRILPLFAGGKDVKQKYRALVEKAYAVGEISLDEYGVILLTNPLEDFVEDGTLYYELLHRWLREKYKDMRILIKKHPRDGYNYQWDDLRCDFINPDIPAEVFLSLIGKQKVLLMYASTLLISLLQKKENVSVITFTHIHGKYKEELAELLTLFGMQDRMVLL